MTREKFQLPPTGWRPPALTASVKVDVVIRQGARCGCDVCCANDILYGGERGPRSIYLRSVSLTRFDHRPPVHERAWNPFTKDTDPPANDPAFIRAVHVDHDKPVTVADVKRMRKTGRIRDGEDDHAAYMAAKQPGQKRGRQSRSFR